MWDRGSELFIECGCYLKMIGELGAIESDWLVRGLGGFLPRKGSEKCPEM